MRSGDLFLILITLIPVLSCLMSEPYDDDVLVDEEFPSTVFAFVLPESAAVGKQHCGLSGWRGGLRRKLSSRANRSACGGDALEFDPDRPPPRTTRRGLYPDDAGVGKDCPRSSDSCRVGLRGRAVRRRAAHGFYVRVPPDRGRMISTSLTNGSPIIRRPSSTTPRSTVNWYP